MDDQWTLTRSTGGAAREILTVSPRRAVLPAARVLLHVPPAKTAGSEHPHVIHSMAAARLPLPNGRAGTAINSSLRETLELHVRAWRDSRGALDGFCTPHLQEVTDKVTPAASVESYT